MFSAQRNSVRLLGLALFAAIWLIVPGCGGDSGNEPTPTPDCAISGVNTSQQTSWLTGEVINIRWTQNGVPGTVMIALLKAGTVVATIAPAAANSGFFPWAATTGGQASGSDFGIRVTGTGDPSCTSEVSGLTIREVAGCNYTFTAALDSIHAGEDFEITWTGYNTGGLLDIELWTSGVDAHLLAPIALGTVDDGSYVWNVDSFNHGTSDTYRFILRDVQVAGCEVASSRFLLIDHSVCTNAITGPTNIPLNNGDQLLIHLEQSNGSGLVNLRLYSGNVFVRGGIIADGISVLDDFIWTVTDYGHTGDNTFYNIRVIDGSDPYCVGETDHFTIIP